MPDSYHDRLDRLEDNVEELAAVVLGTPKTALEGGGRNNDGLAYKVDYLWKQAQNGGLKVHIPWVKILSAFSGIIASIAAVAVAIIENSN